MDINTITKIVIGRAIEVHKHLGPGLLESTYEHCLYYELIQAQLEVQRQLGLPLVYKQITVELGYRMDMLVEKAVIVEVKSVEAIADLHIAQTLTYLRLSGAEVGLILNFNVSKMKNGIKRLISGIN